MTSAILTLTFATECGADDIRSAMLELERSARGVEIVFNSWNVVRIEGNTHYLPHVLEWLAHEGFARGDFQAVDLSWM